MKELASRLKREINHICVGYLFFRKTDMIEKILPLTEDIGKYLNFLLEEGKLMENEENQDSPASVAEVASDYVEALEQRDMVLMADTLEYGLMELLNIYAPPIEEEGKCEALRANTM